MKQLITILICVLIVISLAYYYESNKARPGSKNCEIDSDCSARISCDATCCCYNKDDMPKEVSFFWSPLSPKCGLKPDYTCKCVNNLCAEEPLA